MDAKTLVIDLSNSTIETEEKSALIYVVYNRDIEMMKLLLSSPKINPNIKYHCECGNEQQTESVLEYAIDCEQYDMIQLLLQHGSEID